MGGLSMTIQITEYASLGSHVHQMNRQQTPAKNIPYVDTCQNYLRCYDFYCLTCFLVVLYLLTTIVSLILEIYTQNLKKEFYYNWLNNHCSSPNSCATECYKDNQLPTYTEPFTILNLALYIVSVTILSTFIIENLFIVFSEGRYYFSEWNENYPYYIDFIVVLIAIIVKILYNDSRSGMLLTFRIWRLVRMNTISAQLSDISQLDILLEQQTQEMKELLKLQEKMAASGTQSDSEQDRTPSLQIDRLIEKYPIVDDEENELSSSTS